MQELMQVNMGPAAPLSRLHSSAQAGFSGRGPLDGFACRCGRSHSAPSIASAQYQRHARRSDAWHIPAERPAVQAAAAPAGVMAWGQTDDAQQAASVAMRTAECVAATQQNERRAREGKPLKINLDLKLYRARLARQNANRAWNAKQRAAHIVLAEVILRECLQMDPCDGRAYVSLGRILTQQRRYQEARDLYDTGAQLTESRNAYIWTAWANLESKMGNIKVARKLYDAATVADAEHAAAWHGWGQMEKNEGNLVRAKDLWLKGIRKTQNKPNPYLFQSVAVLASDMGLVEEARKWFRRGTQTLLGQASHALWVSWALMEARIGDETAVRYLFKKGLDVGPRSRYLHLAWATWEKEQGRKNNARQLLERGHLLNAKDAAILQALALLEEEEGNYEAARKYFKAGSEMDSRHIHVWQAWGVMEFRRGNIQRARELFQQGIWADANSRDVAFVWQAWGVLEKTAGNYTLARRLFRCAVKAMPQSEISWQTWAQMEDELGFYQRADNLRRYSLEEQTEVVMPRSFEPPDAILEPVFAQISQWFERFEASTRPSRQQTQPDWMAADGSRLRPPSARRVALGPRNIVPPDALSAGIKAPPKIDGVGAILSREELAEMQLLRDADTLMVELPDAGALSRRSSSSSSSGTTDQRA